MEASHGGGGGGRSNHPGGSLFFDGIASRMTVGTLGNFGAWVSNCTVEFWIKTCCRQQATIFKCLDKQREGGTEQLFCIELNTATTHLDETNPHHKGKTLFKLRDYLGFMLEAEIEDNIYDNAWHKVTIQVNDAFRNDVKVLVDDDFVPISFGKRGCPREFQPWRADASIGATVIGTKHSNCFRGFIKNFKIQSHKHGLVAHWRIDKGSGTTARDMGPHGFKASLLNCQWVSTEYPPTALHFTDNSYVSLGTFETLGSGMRHFSIALWFKADTNNQILTLFSNTNYSESGQSQSIAMKLHTALHSSANDYEKNCMLFYIRDTSGKTLEAAVRTPVVIGRWYHLVWHVSDSTNNQMGVRLNGHEMDPDWGLTENPGDFEPWSLACTLGVTFDLTKHLQGFEGFIKDLVITVNGVPFVDFPIRDGTGPQVRENSSTGMVGYVTGSCTWEQTHYPTADLRLSPKYKSTIKVTDMSGVWDIMEDLSFIVHFKTDDYLHEMVLLELGFFSQFTFKTTTARAGIYMNQTLYNSGNTKYNRQFSQRETLFWIRDSFGNLLEACMTDDVYDGHWHVLHWRINITFQQLIVTVDGRNVKLIYGDIDNPHVWTEPEVDLVIGSSLDFVDHFNGSVKNVEIVDNENEHLVAEWPISESYGVTVSDHSGDDHTGKVLGQAVWDDVNVDSAPDVIYFNGTTSLMNLGVLSHVGHNLYCFEINVWLRTSSTDQGVVIGVHAGRPTDSCFMIELNTNINGSHTVGTTLFVLKDCSERALEAHIEHWLLDDVWHNITWKVQNAAKNEMSVEIDGKNTPLHFGCRRNPAYFARWEQECLIGGTSEGGRMFQGWIKELEIWTVDERMISAVNPVANVLAGKWDLSNGLRGSMKDLSGKHQWGTCHDLTTLPVGLPPRHAYFSGDCSFVSLGTLGDWGLERKHFTYEFWMKSRTSQMCTLMECIEPHQRIAVIGNSRVGKSEDHKGSRPASRVSEMRKSRQQLNINMQYDAGHTYFMLRDMDDKVLEGSIQFEPLYDGQWHHVSWVVQASFANEMCVRIDGKQTPVVFGATEGPDRFEVLGRNMCVGSSNYAESGGLHFSGYIRNIQIWTGHIVAHWPLLENTNELIAGHHAKETLVEWKYCDQPPMNLHFNGVSSLVSVGTLDTLGSYLNGCEISFHMKTNEQLHTMSAFKVLDERKGTMELYDAAVGVDVHCALGEHGWEQGKTLFWIGDSSGKMVEAEISENITDGKWHKITWLIEEPAANKMSVKVDETKVELQYGRKDGPDSFADWQMSACIGATVHSGGETSHHFKGVIKDMCIKLHGSNIASWPLTTGYGCECNDASANGNTGHAQKCEWHPVVPEAAAWRPGGVMHRIGANLDKNDKLGTLLTPYALITATSTLSTDLTIENANTEDPASTTKTPKFAVKDRSSSMFAGSMLPNKARAATKPDNVIHQAGGYGWHSGGPAPQMISLHFYLPYNVTAVELLTDQDVLGFTHHEIWTKTAADNEFTLQHSFRSFTDDNQWLQILFDKPIQDVQWVNIKTIKTPTYVAWRTVHIYGMRPEKRVMTPTNSSSTGTSRSTMKRLRYTGGSTLDELTDNNNTARIPKYIKDDITNTPVTDRQLRELFNKYDVDNNGWISTEEVKAIYNGVENFDLRPSPQQLDNVIHKYNLLGDKRISYDEFAIIMLNIAKW